MLKRHRSRVKQSMGAPEKRRPPRVQRDGEPRGLILAIPTGRHRLRLALAPKGGASYRRVKPLRSLRERLSSFFRSLADR
jgi:hypothetical protein